MNSFISIIVEFIRGRIHLGSDGSVPSDIGSDPGPGTKTLDPIPFRVRPHSHQKKITMKKWRGGGGLMRANTHHNAQ
jgi:hypothetical protein